MSAALKTQNMRVSCELPTQVKGFRYVKNHHYVELEDQKGGIAHLPATGLLRCVCTSCKMDFYVKSNMGVLRCPHCLGNTTYEWGEIQLAFVPEKESDFASRVVLRPTDSQDLEEVNELTPTRELRLPKGDGWDE